MKERVVPETLVCFEIDSFEDLQDLVMIEEADDGFLIAPLWDAEDGVCEVMMLRIHEADHFGKGLQSGEAVIAGPDNVFALLLEIIEKGEDQL